MYRFDDVLLATLTHTRIRKREERERWVFHLLQAQISMLLPFQADLSQSILAVCIGCCVSGLSRGQQRHTLCRSIPQLPQRPLCLWPGLRGDRPGPGERTAADKWHEVKWPTQGSLPQESVIKLRQTPPQSPRPRNQTQTGTACVTYKCCDLGLYGRI